MSSEDLSDCIRIFNENPFEGIKALQNSGLIREDHPEDVGEFLHSNNLDKKNIGELITSFKGDKYRKSFIEYFQVEDIEFLDAIRLFLSKMTLPGESQKIDRIISEFAEHYIKTAGKPAEIFNSADACYILIFCIIMLNTDLHSTYVKNKLSIENFKANCIGINDGNNFDDDFLTGIYERLTKNPMTTKESAYGESKHSGNLFKKKFFGWGEFYCKLNTQNELYYYNNVSEDYSDVPIGFFDLNNVSIETQNDGARFIFTITSCDGKLNGGKFVNKKLKKESFSSLILAASTMDELEDWCDAILGNYKALPSANAAKSAKK